MESYAEARGVTGDLGRKLRKTLTLAGVSQISQSRNEHDNLGSIFSTQPSRDALAELARFLSMLDQAFTITFNALRQSL